MDDSIIVFDYVVENVGSGTAYDLALKTETGYIRAESAIRSQQTVTLRAYVPDDAPEPNFDARPALEAVYFADAGGTGWVQLVNAGSLGLPDVGLVNPMGMNLGDVLDSVAKKMLADFAASGAVQHRPSKGTVRESNLLNPTRNAESVLAEGVPHPRHVIVSDDQVEVLVRPRLLADQRVHAPATIEPDGHIGISEPSDNLDDVGFGERHAANVARVESPGHIGRGSWCAP